MTKADIVNEISKGTGVEKAQVQQIPGYDQKLLNEETASSEDK